MTKHWANYAEKTSALGIRFLLWIHRVFGRWPFRVILGPVSLFYWLTDAKLRANSLDYLMHAHAAGLFTRKPDAYLSIAHVHAFSQTIADKFLSLAPRRLGEEAGELIIENEAFIQDLLAKKTGAIVLTSHMGCIEKLIHYGVQFEEAEIVILTHTQHAQAFNALLGDMGEDLTKVRFMEVTALTPASALEIEEAIERGALVFIAGDRVPIASSATVAVSFLGEDAHFPTGGIILANLLHVPLLSMICWRGPKEKPDAHTVRFKVLSESVALPRKGRQEGIRALVEDFVSEIEYGLHQSPLDWFNFYAFWEKPREKAND